MSEINGRCELMFLNTSGIPIGANQILNASDLTGKAFLEAIDRDINPVAGGDVIFISPIGITFQTSILYLLPDETREDYEKRVIATLDELLSEALSEKVE